MDECQLYSALLELKSPRNVEKVFLEPEKKVVGIYIAHEKGSKLPCPVYRRGCMVYYHLHERVRRDLDSIEFMTSIHANPQGYPARSMAQGRPLCHGPRGHQDSQQDLKQGQ